MIISIFLWEIKLRIIFSLVFSVMRKHSNGKSNSVDLPKVIHETLFPRDNNPRASRYVTFSMPPA